VDTATRTPTHTPTRSWDIAPLLLAGVVVGLIGPLLAGAGNGLAALLSLAGLVLMVTGLVRWTRRPQRSRAV
jgi:predicted lipid-binding transport protein (Tim44 family)